MLRKMECYLTKSKLEAIRDMLVSNGIEGMTVTQVQGFGTRSKKDRNGKPMFEERIKIEIVLDESLVDNVIRQIRHLAGAGTIGAGKVFVIPVEDAVRLSTSEAGRSAVV